MLHRVLAGRLGAPTVRTLPVLLLLGALVTAFPGDAAAQQNCKWGSGTRSFSSTTVPGLGRITYVSRPHLVCADGVEIWADSAVSYADQGMSDLFGHVRYHDRSRLLRADSARYFSRMDRLQAHGSLFLQDTAQGSIIRHGDLVYLRKSSERAADQMTVTIGANGVRPHATLHMRPAVDTASAPTDTTHAAKDTTHAATDTTHIAKDTTHTATDTTHAAKDTTHAATDTTHIATDTTHAAKDTTHAATDTTHIAKDTTHAAPDTARAALDSASAPTDTLPPAPPPPPDTTPYNVVANRIFLEGNSYFLATGNVEIQRDSLQAYSDSAQYDQVAGRLVLNGRARVQGSSYNLNAERINIAVPRGAIRDVHAIGEAVLVGQDLRLTAPTIYMFLRDGLLNRLVAIPLLRDSTPVTPADSARAARPNAVAEKFHLTADSLQVDAPGQELKRIFATGSALGVSDARDSLNTPSLPKIARHDWVAGDTVIVTFVPVPQDSLDRNPRSPSDSAKARFRVDRLVASGDARSLYRLPPPDSAAPPGECPPAVHYVKGSRITIAMKQGEVDSMQVDGPTQGYHLEPENKCPPDSAAQDSTKAAHDTAGVRSDTARTDTSRIRRSTRRSGRGGGGGGRRMRDVAAGFAEPSRARGAWTWGQR